MSDNAKLQFHLMPIRRETKRPLSLHGEKDASDVIAIIRRWKVRFPNCNWAVACGPSNLIAIDEDSYKPEYVPGLLEKMVGLPELPLTAEWKSGRGGRVRLYRRPNGVDVKPGPLKELGVPGVDVKASAGYVVCPPSVNSEGGRYEWTYRPEEVGIAEAPQELIDLLTMAEVGDLVGPGLSSSEGELYLKSGHGRWGKLQRFAGGLRRWGWGEAAIFAALSGFAELQCEPDETIAPEKIREIAHWAGSLLVEEDPREKERILFRDKAGEIQVVEKESVKQALLNSTQLDDDGEFEGEET